MDEGEGTQFTHSITKTCPNCGEVVDIEFIISTDGSIVDVTPVEDEPEEDLGDFQS